MSELLPVFLKLEGRSVLLVGGGRLAKSKLPGLLAAGAAVRVVAPEIDPEIARSAVTLERRGFEPADLEGAWLVVAAATPEVNRAVSRAAEERRVFVNAVDDVASATAYLGGVVRKGGVVVAVSTQGKAPALAGLLREALEAILPDELELWIEIAKEERAAWKQARVPMTERRPLLLRALDRIYAGVVP